MFVLIRFNIKSPAHNPRIKLRIAFITFYTAFHCLINKTNSQNINHSFHNNIQREEDKIKIKIFYISVADNSVCDEYDFQA